MATNTLSTPSSCATPELRLHATCLTMNGKGLLLLGKSGSGKSDLALRLISQPFAAFTGQSASAEQFATAKLVADDQVLIRRSGAHVFAKAPPALFGLIEVRGIGIVAVPSVSESELVLAVDLVKWQSVERMPEPTLRMDVLGIQLPLIRLDPFEVSAPAKLALALARMNTMS